MRRMSTSRWFRKLVALVPLALLAVALVGPAMAQEATPHAGGEANLVLPDLGQATFFSGLGGRTILMGGIAVSLLGLAFGLVIYTQLKNMPVHKSMLEISELIYETCKTYLTQQGKFLLILEAFIGAIIFIYFF